jgi:polysaccharide chain length determinant protein (PEP-CTERM system associated)
MFTIGDVIAMLRRRWLLLALPVVVIAPIVAVIAMLLPPVYSSSARILVETQQIPSALARSTIAQSAEESIQFIQQRLLTRQNLLDIAEQYSVFGSRPDMSPTQIFERMQAATTIQGTGIDTRRRNTVSVVGVRISFEANSPQVAARVANEFVSRILAENVQGRIDRASGTVAFFAQEVARLEAEIDAVAARITEFKNQNLDALPETLASRQSQIESLRSQLASRAGQQALMENRRRALEQAIAIGRGAPETMSPLQRQLVDLQSTLNVRRATLAESHPTIRQLTAQISALEQTIEASRAVNSDGAPDAPVTGLASEALIEIEALENQLDFIANQNDIDTTRIANLEASIARTPAVEMTLNALQRDYVGLQLQYQDALSKQSQAEVGERLEAGQQAERFEVIEQAVPADRPDSPNRPLIIAVGTVGSIGLGFGLMILAELMNRSLRTARDLERQLQIRPIVSIPNMRTETDMRRSAWLFRTLVLTFVLGVPVLGWLIDEYYQPLPVLAQRIMVRLGVDNLMASLGL